MLVLIALLCALAVPAAANAAADPSPSAFGFGRIAPVDDFAGDDFTTFAFAATKRPDGSAHGLAVFRGIAGNPSASLTARVDCLRTGIDTIVDEVPTPHFVRRTYAMISGSVVHATDSGLIGRYVLFGMFDGEQTTGMDDTTDRISADFNGLQPGVNCENAAIALLPPVVAGEVVVGHIG